jgi:hypothetical protein
MVEARGFKWLYILDKNYTELDAVLESELSLLRG